MKRRETTKVPSQDVCVAVVDRRRIPFRVVLMLLLVLFAYANAFTASWHMDDYPNILSNPAVQMTRWNPASLMRAVGIDRSEGNNLSRPVANLSFALNWYLHGANVAGFHLVNLIIHIGNALLLYGIILLLGATPYFPHRYRTTITSIAVGASLVWALNPIQSQAVTYIVQRMASLSAFFYLAALTAYLKLRLATGLRYKIGWGLGLGVGFLLALGTKENAITLPLALVLVEWIFFQNGRQCLADRRVGIVVASGAALTAFFVYLFFFLSDQNIIHTLNRGYDIRPFTLSERMLTQPRVLLFYISLLIYPIPQRLSLEHDFVVSTSLLEPWSTLPAILAVAAIIAFGVMAARKRPLLGFAILFFFLNQAVESTFLPLELVFEHRNYLPSMFIFLPLAAGWQDVKSYCQLRNRRLVWLLKIGAFLIIAVLCAGTYLRNLDWQSERSLWTDAHRKAPGSARPVFNLAKDFERRGHYQQAIALYRESMALQPPRLKHFEVMALTNIGTIFYKTGHRLEAIAYYREALERLPETSKSHYNLAVAYTQTRQYELAQAHIVWLLTKNPRDEAALDLMALIQLKRHRSEGSLTFSRRLLRMAPDSRSANLQIGAAYTRMGQPAKGDWFLHRADRVDPGNLTVMFCMLENRLAAGDMEHADQLRTRIFHRYSVGRIGRVLTEVNEIGNVDALAAYVEKGVREACNGLSAMKTDCGKEDEDAFRL